MKTLWCKNQENPSDRISHTWAPLTFFLYLEDLDVLFLRQETIPVLVRFPKCCTLEQLISAQNEQLITAQTEQLITA